MSSSSEPSGLMADPYASAGGAPSSDMPPTPSAPPTLPSGWAASQEFLGGASAGGSSPDYLFETDLDPSFRRSWGERLTFHVGGAYLVGMLSGGSYGLYHGLRDSVGERQRIRVNKVLNSTAKTGPGLANSLGCVAMMGSIFESIAYNIRGEDDLLNPAGAAALTGVIYKITSGPKAAAAAGLGLGAFAATATLLTKQMSKSGMLKNFL